MGDDDVLISDVGAHKMWTARHYPTYAPNTCIISNGFCSMGIAAARGSIGAKLAAPTAGCVALSGDGGFLMNVAGAGHGPASASHRSSSCGRTTTTA